MVVSVKAKIRTGTPTDMAGVLSLLSSAGLPTDDLKELPHFQMWIMEHSDSILGVIGMERFGMQGLLRSLTVVPAVRRHGFGRELVATLEHDAKAIGVRQLTLLTETAEKFFAGLGYRIIDRRSVSSELQQTAEFRSLCPASAVCMTKAIQDQMGVHND